MHLSLPLSFFASVAFSYVSAEAYTPQSLNKSLTDSGLQSYALNANSSRGWNQGTRCEVACDLLSTVLKDQVSNSSSTIYSIQSSSYWAQQQSSIRPACYVLAKDTRAVSAVITVARLTQCPFAVKSGGHSDVPGASNIQEGVTLDLKQLNSVEVSSDRKIATVGTGGAWGTVYGELERMGLTVIGGRVTSVGVGGLILGGGISYFSGRYGFASDNVAMFELVMADGRVANITYQTNPDLYFALRGGANNFGIVTKFHLETHPLGEMWGGVKVYPAAANLTLSKAVETFLDNAHTDPDASIIASYSYRDGNFSTSCIFDHAKPQANPPIFDAFLALENEKTFDSTRTANLTSFTNELNSGVPKGFRQRFTTATFKNSAALQSQVIDIFVSEVNAIQGSITNRTGFNPIISFEPIFTAPREVLNRNGGNAFSPPTTDGPWMFVLFSFTWASVTDDANVLRAIENLTNRSIAAAKAKGLLTEYIYLNDAGPEQLPFEGYGAGNLQRLRQISKKYDPEAIFQRLLPGGFKLGIDGKY